MARYEKPDGSVATAIHFIRQRNSSVGTRKAANELSEIHALLLPFQDDAVVDCCKLTTLCARNMHRLFEHLIEEECKKGGARKITGERLQDTLAEHGIDTWPMSVSTVSRAEHPLCVTPENVLYSMLGKKLASSFGHLNLTYLRSRAAQDENSADNSRWGNMVGLNTVLDLAERGGKIHLWVNSTEEDFEEGVKELVEVMWQRLYTRPEIRRAASPYEQFEYVVCNSEANVMMEMAAVSIERATLDDMPQEAIGPNLDGLTWDIRAPKQQGGPEEAVELGSGGGARLEDVEIVIVRPNIEHSMLGIIMGLGGSELGSTLWGQTELSVYDDSMHGIWGMCVAPSPLRAPACCGTDRPGRAQVL